ncbi:hypothetical protein C8R43DRAFT_1038081 [Mycena crocata]|nr:hypothetical protein C8R43DRAFT_1038081 [Mycena crocata]
MSLWNFTIEDTSPFLTYTPYADGSNSGLTKGWEPWYTESGFISQNGQGGAGDSYHLTSLDGASVNLEFYGTAVYMYGTTNSSYDTILDHVAYTHESPASDLLLSITDLKEGTHSVTLTARPTSSSQQLAFDRAVVSAPLVNNETPREAFYDNTDATRLRYTGDWSSSTAPGIPNASVTHPWEQTFAQGASVSMDIGPGAVGVSLWGMTNWGNWVFQISVDGSEKAYNGSTFWKVPDALLYYQAGLDPTKNHTVIMTNTTPKMKLAFNSMRVYNIQTDVTPPGTNSVPVPSPTNSSAPSAHSSVKAGVIAGPIIGVLLVVALLCGFLYWRSRRNRSSSLTATQDNVVAPGNSYTDRSPHRPVFPTGYTGATSTTALTSPKSPAMYSISATQVSGPPGATVMTWGSDMSPHTSGPSSASHDQPYSSTYAPSSDGSNTESSVRQGRLALPPIPVGKMRSPPPAPAPPSSTLDSPDVDRLIELIAQRIDRGRGNDESAPPEYRG